LSAIQNLEFRAKHGLTRCDRRPCVSGWVIEDHPKPLGRMPRDPARREAAAAALRPIPKGEQGVRPFGDRVDAANGQVVLLLGRGEVAAFGLLGRHPQRQGGRACSSAATSPGAAFMQVASCFPARSHGADPDRPAVRVGHHLHVPAVVLVLCGPPQVRAVRAGMGDLSVRITLPPRFRYPCPGPWPH
jgi:hypothetical protein